MIYILSNKHLSIEDILSHASIQSGIGVFETMAIDEQYKIEYLDYHLDRLYTSNNFLHLNLPLRSNIKNQIYEVISEIKKTNNNDRVLKLIVFKNNEDPIIFITSRENKYTYKQEPIHLGLSSCIRDCNNSLVYHKTCNRFMESIESEHAKNNGFYDCLFTNQNNEITETSRANLFFSDSKDNIITPPLESGLLPGIIRRVLLETGSVIEKKIRLTELTTFKGSSITNSLALCIAVQSIQINSHETFTFRESNLLEYRLKMLLSKHKKIS